MKVKSTAHYLLFFFIAVSQGKSEGRSPHRTEHQTIPHIAVCWADDHKEQAFLRDSHLEEYPLFELFDKKYFEEHLIPNSTMLPRNNKNNSIQGEKLKKHLEILLKEIKAKKKKYTHFELLTDKNFNRHKRVGMLILRYKHGPYIVKASIETPQSFIDPFCKGLDNVWFFPMGGGINRHLAGLTRVKNQENVKRKLSLDPYWNDHVDVPRKWYWLPEAPRWLVIKGDNIGSKKKQSIVIPGAYAIIADAIEVERELELKNEDDTQLALNLCNYLEHAVDAHINNFVVEKETKKVVIIDTEHFLSVIGIKEKVHVDSYFDWYMYLIKKCGNAWFFRTKKERLAAQRRSDTIRLA